MYHPGPAENPRKSAKICKAVIYTNKAKSFTPRHTSVAVSAIRVNALS